MDTNTENIEILSKRIDNYALYIYADLYDFLKSIIIDDKSLSKETQDLLRRLSESLHKDVGHLECDEMYHWYIVEEGYNYND